MGRLTRLVTGCSSGIGGQFIHGILSRGDRVIATSRKASVRLLHLKEKGATILDLDITASQKEIDAKVQEALEVYGGLDVLVNNAGYIEAALFEEATHERLLSQFSTNLFGTLAITRSILPHFRQKKTGVIAFMGSTGGWAGDPGAAPYCGTKFALEGMVECLQKETSHFGIRSIIFEPGYFRTKIFSESNVKTAASTISEYDDVSAGVAGFVAATNGSQPGDPKKLVERVIDVVKSEGMAAGKVIPPRLPLGPDGLAVLKGKCEATLKICEEWESLITSTDLDM